MAIICSLFMSTTSSAPNIASDIILFSHLLDWKPYSSNIYPLGHNIIQGICEVAHDLDICTRLLPIFPLPFSDTSFLEFCLKQSRSEAEILLKENLGSIDRDYAFIDKFLNYKDFLPSDVLKLAFQSGGDYKVSGDANAELGSNNADGGPIKVVGKKKGKKGKKISSDVLGFNVVSNRIMMGEIQTIED